jgi:hypothetical protein
MATRDPFCRRKAAARKIAVRVGDHERGVRGSDDPSDVLADRSRLQKSTGGVRPVATEGEEPSEPTSGLAASGESSGKRKRAGSRVFGGKAEIPVAGSHQNRHAKARPFGSTCRWKAFWVEQAAPFDEGVGEAILGASSEAWSTRPRRARGATESVRGRSPASRAADNAAARWHRSSSGRLRLELPEMWSRRGEWSKGPKLGTAPSSALYLGLGRRKAGWRRSCRRAPARVVAAVGEAKAARSGITRSTGARVVSRLQKSARSIFLARSRGAERQTEKARGSTPRRFLP